MASYLPKMWSADGPISKPDCTSAQYFCASGRKLLEPNGHNDSHMMVLSPYMADPSFHSNIFVILAALFCALISVAGLLSLLQFALRCGRQVTGLEEAGHVTVGLANTGMKKAAVNALPSFVYGTGSRLPERSSDCPICLGEFAEGDNVRVLPKCSHSFHVECIDKWLQSHSSCPSCRHNLVVDLEEDTTKLTMASNSPP